MSVVPWRMLAVLAVAVVVASCLLFGRRTTSPVARPTAAAAPAERVPAEDDAVAVSFRQDAEAGTTDAIRITAPEGVETVGGFPAKVTLHDGRRDHELVYVGHMVKSQDVKLFEVELYRQACYIPEPKPASAERLLAQVGEDGPRLMMIRFSRTLPGLPMVTAIRADVTKAFAGVDMDRYGAAIESFVTSFEDGASEGDYVHTARLPNNRIFSGWNTPEKLPPIARGRRFADALFGMWVGPHGPKRRHALVSRFATDA